MATPSSGQIAFSDMAWVVFANYNAYTELNNSDIRYLLNKTSGQIAISDAYSKPSPTSYSYTSPGAYSLVVPAYQYFSVDVRGGGGGGNGGNGSNTNVCWCGQFCFFPCCGGQGGATPGGSGGDSYIRGAGIDVTAFAGSGGGVGGGYGGNVINGGGGGGGSAGYPWGCSGSGGSGGGSGGRVTNTFTKSSGSVPYYGYGITVLVGGGGGGGYNGGGNGGDGAVYISTS
jgi:hypothetical protein